MAGESVYFFHRELPVVGDAPVIPFKEGDYKFWSVVTRKGERCLTFREMIGVVSLQERLDHFLRCESSQAQPAGYKMIFADHVRPARSKEVEAWAKVHPKQMETYG